MEPQENDVIDEVAREIGEMQMDAAMEGSTERGVGPRSLELKEAVSRSDPDLLGGHSCVLLELLHQTCGLTDRIAKRQQLTTTLERIEKWSILRDRADEVFSTLWERNGAIEVFKKAKELFPTQFRETEPDTVQLQAESDRCRVELLKGIVFKLVKEIDGLELETQELLHEVGQNKMEMEVIRRKAEELEDTVRERNMEIQVIRRKTAAETKLTVASMETTTSKAKEDELRIESLEKQLAETEARVASMEATTRREKTLAKLSIDEASSRVTALARVISQKSKDGESQIDFESLQKQLAGESKELLEIRKVKTFIDKFWETEVARGSKEVDRTSKQAEEDLEDFRVAKRAKIERGTEDTRMDSVENEGEADGAGGKYASELGGPNDKSNVNNSNHVQVGVGTNSVEEEDDGRSRSGDRHVVKRKDVDELQCGHVTERNPGDELQFVDVTEKNYGDELQGGHMAERKNVDELQGGLVTERNDENELQSGHVTESNDGDELQGGNVTENVAERNDRVELQGSGAAMKIDVHGSNSVDILRQTEGFAAAQESKLLDWQNVTPKIEKMTENTSQLPQSPLNKEECHHEGEEFSKLVDKSANTSPPTIPTMSMGWPHVPLGSQSVSNEDNQGLQPPVSDPITSAPSHNDTTPSLEQGSKLAISVPDPDFHDFDSSRMETDILPGQIWAIYDDYDAMPRYYARVNEAQTEPFTADLNWLEHCPANGEEIAWTKNTGLSIACGNFKIGASVVKDSINVFSHCVVDKISTLKIYPKKGQVWAVYRDPEQWKGATGGPRVHAEANTLEYEMVEILSEYCDKYGLRAGTLEKVLGFKTVFRRENGIEAIRSYKPAELVKFSHFVPNYGFEDSERVAHGVPHESLELDPAATPLGVITSPSVRGGKSTTDGTKAQCKSEEHRKWVKLLKPIARLPTNVGSRIRNRVRDALEADPPEWAAKLLENSISRQVYKGNAAGPTKRIVVQILDKVSRKIAG